MPKTPEKGWNLRLYVAGQTPKSVTAFANLKKICEEHLTGSYTIEVIDLLENPQAGPGRPDPGHPHPGAQTAGAHQENHRGPVRYRKGAGGPGFTASQLTIILLLNTGVQDGRA